MPTDTKLNQLIINQLTQEQYDEAKAAGTLSDTELYITDSDDDALTNNKISNCIAEIPQDIKLELNNGTLTLKAGSKVYVPNGTGVFKEIIVSDNTNTQSLWGLSKYFVVFKENNRIEFVEVNSITSSTTQPEIINGRWWYDTANNKIKRCNGTAWIETNCSLPIALISTTDGSTVSSIDQVFNGFGYIGSTVFALPGVKGRIPNGRNANGSLKSIEFTITGVKTSNIDANWINQDWFIYPSEDITWYPLQAGEVNYDESKNLWLDTRTASGVEVFCNFGHTTASSGKITSFTPKTVFHALDYNDKSTISGWSMPSSRYIDLTLGASGSTYTAPANGWFALWLKDNMPSQGRIVIRNDITKFGSGIGNNNNLAGYTALNYPASKGTIVTIYYEGTSAPSSYRFRFIYAEGESNV